MLSLVLSCLVGMKNVVRVVSHLDKALLGMRMLNNKEYEWSSGADPDYCGLLLEQ